MEGVVLFLEQYLVVSGSCGDQFVVQGLELGKVAGCCVSSVYVSCFCRPVQLSCRAEVLRPGVRA